MPNADLRTNLLGPTGALRALTQRKQFILWLRSNKLPASPITGQVIDAHIQEHHVNAVVALEAMERLGSDTYGVGFVFREDDPFFFLDIDHCQNNDGTWNDWGLQHVNSLPGAAVEISQGGDGLHIIGRTASVEHTNRYSEPPPSTKKLELYTRGRYMALGGQLATGDANTDHTAALAGVISQYFDPKPVIDVGTREWTDYARVDWTGPESDSELIQKAIKSTSSAAMFDGRPQFINLWNADADILGAAWPGNNADQPYNASSADAALASQLAFWTGNNCERIVRVMLMSRLNREKWNREDYLRRTVMFAVSRQATVYTGGTRPTPTQPVTSAQPTADTPPVQTASNMDIITEPVRLSGLQLLMADQQIDYFKDWCYIRDIKRIFVPDGGLLDLSQVNDTYGGYEFAIDSENRKTTRKPWEAFTQSQIVRFPKVHSPVFKPDLEPGNIFRHEGKLCVNTFVPIKTKRVVGDPTPFLAHIAKLLPDPHDQQILISYLAALVQHLGKKFTWAILVQGVEGNGKSLISQCLQYAVGYRYSCTPKASALATDFNAWLAQNLLAVVEDVYVPTHKREIWETLKPMITDTRQEIHFKGVDQYTGSVIVNFILNSNHKDALPKTANDRRICYLGTAQQSVGDLRRDGLTPKYFDFMVEWLYEKDGLAIVNEYLHTVPISDSLNPATGCKRAPMTSTTDVAIAANLGVVEQNVVLAIAEDRLGFRGGWVSSTSLDHILTHLKMDRAIPPNKRRALMQALGYDWHPALNNGRLNNPIPSDPGTKPIIYIKDGNTAVSLSTAAEVAKAYEAAQRHETITA